MYTYIFTFLNEPVAFQSTENDKNDSKLSL